MTLRDLIDKVIAAKVGDKDLALFHHHDNGWTAQLGNPSEIAMLGEVEGEFAGYGETPEEAMQAVIEAVERHNREVKTK